MLANQIHYLVTGAAGFIGSHLSKALIADEKNYVSGIDNFDPSYKRHVKLQNLEDLDSAHNFVLHELDLAQISLRTLNEVVPQKVDIIIHLAAKAGVQPSLTNPAAFIKNNILSTQTLLDFAVQKKVKKFIFASSSSVYGINKNLPWKEDEKLLPISPYAMTKLAGEDLGHVYNKLYALPFMALRLFTVYGPGQRPDLAIHRFTKAILNDKPIPMYGDGTTSRDYTYIDDIVKGLQAAIRYDSAGFDIINLGNHHTISLSDLISELEIVTGKKAIIDKLPQQPGDVMHTYADITKAKKLLHYNPGTSLREGIQQFYNWFENHHELLMMR